MFHRFVIIGLFLAASVSPAWSQRDTGITALGHNADIVAFATAEKATQTPGAVAPDVTLTIQLRVTQALKGQPAMPDMLASVAERCGNGGSGRRPLCVRQTQDIAGLTGIWFLKSTDTGYQIQPRNPAAGSADELFLPLTGPPDPVPAPDKLDEALLKYLVRWFQALVGPEPRLDERLFAGFQPWGTVPPSEQQTLTAVAPLIDSPYPGQHAAGLVVALRAGSADAMAQVVNELSALRSNPRFFEIVSAVGENKDPSWIAPFRQLIALHADVPGLDAAAAGSLYRIGPQETLPLVAELLNSKDPGAQMIAVKTLAIWIPAGTLDNAKYYPGMKADPSPTTPEFVAYWKTWWSQNRAHLGLPFVADTPQESPSPHPDGPKPHPFINPNGIVRADTSKPGLLSPGIVFSVYGRDFGPAAGCRGAAKELCGVQVLLDGKPIEVQFTSDVLINARMPDAAPDRLVSLLIVIAPGGSSDPVEVRRLPETATISLEGVARVEGPVWIHVELSRSQPVGYPAMVVPWEFGCDAFEVRKDGKPLDPIPVRMPAAAAPSSGCPQGAPGLQKSRLPLHLQYEFDEPGAYEVRLSHYGDSSRRPGDIRAQSAWTPIEVLPAQPRIPLPSPDLPELIVTNFLPNLLAQRNDETLWILLGDLYNPSPLVRSYAADALYYWPDSVIVPHLLQTVRSYGPAPEAIEHLGSHVLEILDLVLPNLMSASPAFAQGALAAARIALSDSSPIAPEVRARAEQTLIAVASNPATPLIGDLIPLLGQIKGDQVRDLLWSLADRRIAAPVTLNAVAMHKDATDLPRLADYLLAAPADNQTDQALVAIPNVLRSQFGPASSLYLQSVMERAPSQPLRIACAKELMLANDPAGFAFALDALERNRPWKAQIVSWVNGQFPESRNKPDAQVATFLRERSGAAQRN